MARGGLRKDNQGTTNHLFSSKWKLGKTKAIRVPEILADRLVEVAKYFDVYYDNYQDTNIVKIIDEFENSKLREIILQNKVDELNKEIEFYKTQIEIKNKLVSENNLNNKYKIAFDCFNEYLEFEDIEILESKLPRKGTIKRKLFDVSTWFQNRMLKC